MNAPDRDSNQHALQPGIIGIAGAILVALIAAVVFWSHMPWADKGNPDDPRNKFSGDLVAEAQALFDLHDQALADVKEARRKASEEFQSYVEVRLREHDARQTIARKELGEAVAAYFEERKAGIPAYADDALTWKNRWAAFWDSEAFRKKLDDLFAQHVLTSSGMAESIGRAVESYLGRINAEERALLAELRQKANGLPALGLQANLGEESFRKLIDETVAAQAAEIVTSTRIMGVSMSMAAVLAVVVAPHVTIGAGPLASLAPLADAIILMIRVQILSYVAGAFLSDDEIQSSALRLLDDLKRVLDKGADEVWNDYHGLEEMVKNEQDAATRQRAIDLMNHMRNSGQLGLDALLRYVQDRNVAHKAQVFKILGATP